MSRFVLYMDEDSESHDVAAGLRRRGIEVHRSGDHGNNGRPDSEQLAFAAQMGWTIYSANVADFAELHRAYQRQGVAHSGIILRTRQVWSIGDQVRRIANIWNALDSEVMANRLESLAFWGSEH